MFPGEDLTVCYIQMPDNYDNSLIVMGATSDRGCFSTISLCTYRISEEEDIPVEGERLCGKKFKWWKGDYTDSCVC